MFSFLVVCSACQSSQEEKTEPETNDTTMSSAAQSEDLQAFAKSVDDEVAGLEEDGTSERKDKEWHLADGSAKMHAWYKDEKLLMIQEETVSSKAAQRQRYYFKENKLVYATEYSVDKQCSDTTDVCVNETRCYFDNDRMVCEYTRAVSIPAEKLNAFDDPYLHKALEGIEMEQRSADPLKEPTIKQNADDLIEKWEGKGDT